MRKFLRSINCIATTFSPRRTSTGNRPNAVLWKSGIRGDAVYANQAVAFHSDLNDSSVGEWLTRRRSRVAYRMAHSSLTSPHPHGIHSEARLEDLGVNARKGQRPGINTAVCHRLTSGWLRFLWWRSRLGLLRPLDRSDPYFCLNKLLFALSNIF